MTLSNGSNSYSGLTTLNSGTLAISGSDRIGSGSSALTVAGGTLSLGSTTQYFSSVAINGGTIQNGTLGALSFTATNAGAATISANLVDGITADGVTTAAPLTMNGTGTLTLSGTNTYTGATTINSSRVLVDGSLIAASSVTVGNNATLGGAGNGTTTGIINGNVSILSGGTLRRRQSSRHTPCAVRRNV